jgi:beta-galactosidase
MLDHQARKDYSFDEIAGVFGELTRLNDVIDATRFVASTAILYDDEIGWAFNFAVSNGLGQMQARQDVSTQGRLLRWYAPLYGAKVGTDIIDPCRDLSGYKVVFAPNLYLINPEIVANLEAYVRAGGWLVMGCKSGLKNWNSVFFSDLPPAGGLAEIFGATTLTPAPPPWYGGAAPATALNMDADAPFAAGMSFANVGLADLLDPAAAVAWAHYADGHVAVTANDYGRGKAILVGCEPDEAFHRCLIEWLAAEGKLEPALDTDADVEATLRVGGGHRLTFVLNYRAEPAQIVLKKEYRELISERTVSGVFVLPGGQVAILDEPES